MRVIAVDARGNEFPKTVIKLDSPFEFSKGELIISFGWPCEYMVTFIMKHYPYQHPLVIDSDGRNHKGHEVSVSAE